MKIIPILPRFSHSAITTFMDRTRLYLIIGLVAIGAALLLNLLPVEDRRTPVGEIITNGDVRGAALIYAGKPYTLNFKQQEEFVNWMNRAVPVTHPEIQGGITDPDFEKVVVYRFNDKPNLTLKPVGYLKTGNLVFTIEEDQNKGFYLDTSQGQMKKLLTQIHE
jgi:CBS domain-containing protein